MTQQTVSVLIFVAFVFLIPALFIVTLCFWWSARKKLRTIASLVAPGLGPDKAVEETKRVLAEKGDAQQKVVSLTDRFSRIIDQETELTRIKTEAVGVNEAVDNLRTSYAAMKATFDRMKVEVAIFDERLAFAEMGVYEPHFEFSDSEAYKAAVARVRDLQKSMISAKTAIVCTTSWSVDGSAAKGQTLTNRNIKLSLRAFNNECDAAIANTRWNNVNAMEKRIQRASEQIDNINATNAIYIQKPFLDLKIEELYLTHEQREKIKSERDERAEGARLAREEQKLQRDLERAQDEEARYTRLLERAKAEAAATTGPQLGAFSEQIQSLERDLADAHAKLERAQSMAERTRSGYVYIISNVGSFGEDVVKIGLTRRLDPIDRVRELGDASVPFVFDIHAIIYSDDAPGLEHALHSEFEATRVNGQNYRKEFFRVSLEAVEDAVKRIAPGASFMRDIEAQEFRETLARRQLALEDQQSKEFAFPDAI